MLPPERDLRAAQDQLDFDVGHPDRRTSETNSRSGVAASRCSRDSVDVLEVRIRWGQYVHAAICRYAVEGEG